MYTRLRNILDQLANKYWLLLFLIAFLNILIRLIIFTHTNIFSFSDYQVYINGIEKIANGEKLSLVNGNFLLTISYLGYFFKYILGNLNYFFAFNIVLATGSSIIIALIVKSISNSRIASLLALILLTVYSEFMVFSSVFYTPIIMIFLLSFLLFLLLHYYRSERKRAWFFLSFINVIILLSYLFKPELIFLPLFTIPMAIILRKDVVFFRRTIAVSITMIIVTIGFYSIPLQTGAKITSISNSFIFFGHTDYGGDGGEGAFIYPDNIDRYNSALEEYKANKNLKNINIDQLNDFRKNEIRKFISMHPLKWTKLQFTKFFRTFGVVPEGNSFKVLYTGLLKEKLWLTAFLIVIPIPIFVLLFIQMFNIEWLRLKLRNIQSYNDTDGIGHFMYIYIVLFLYYILASCFFGHYQERYRMPIIACFVVPVVAIFILNLTKKTYVQKPGFYIRMTISVVFLIIWIYQAKTAISNQERLKNAIDILK